MARGDAIDILDGLSSSTAAKGPCALKTTGNVVLAGEQSIDGTTTAESRVLAGSQTDPTENGIYVTSTGDWRRAADYSRNNDVVNGTFVVVNGGATGSGLWKTTFTGTLEIGVTSITFVNFVDTAGFVTAATVAAAIAAAVAGYQPLDSDLSAIAALATTAFGRALLALANQGAAQTALGLAIGTNVQAYDARNLRAQRMTYDFIYGVN